MRIYIAGPYSAPDEAGRVANVTRALDVGLQVLLKGHQPYIPHLTHWIDLHAATVLGERLPVATYYEYDLAWLRQCEAILMLDGWDNSQGCQVEHYQALEWLMPIYYGSASWRALPSVERRIV